MDKADIDQRVEQINALLGEKLGVTGRSLEVRVRRAGRGLPRTVRLAAQDLVQAEQMSQEPKMLRYLDDTQVEAAYAACLEHLEAIDERALRSQARFALAATLTVQVFVVAAALLAVLRWRGFV